MFIEGNATIDDKHFKLTLRIPNTVITDTQKNIGNLDEGEYNFYYDGFSVSNYGQITAHITSLDKAGQSARQNRNEALLKFAKKHRLLKRRRRKLPTKVERLLCLTSKGSDIKLDIVANTGLPSKQISVYNCYSAQVIADNIASARNVDCIVLYRGGHEDSAMGMFSDEVVLLAIANSAIPVCVALGHEQDKPFVYQVADLTYSTPSAFGKSIHQHNERRGYRRLKIVFALWVLATFAYLLY